jgi:hypothetical protein
VNKRDHARYVARIRKQEAAAAPAAQASVEGTVVDRMRDELVPMFKEPWDARHQVTDLLTGRRVGKTEYICRVGARGAALNRKSINPLILPTAKQARLVLWPILKRVLGDHFPDAKINETEMRAYIPEGGQIVVGGCEHDDDVGKWFGLGFEEALIDECGNYKPHLRRLFDDGIRPGTMDFDGRVTRSGNPSILCSGPWYDWTGPEAQAHKLGKTLYMGDARCNPYIADAQAFFNLVLEENQWTEQTPTFIRMYLGQWCMDSGALVYPFTYEQDNFATVLPTRSATGDPVYPGDWRYGLGMDVGYVDLTTYVVHAEGHSEWIDDQKVERALQLAKEFGVTFTVIDPGGGGKNVIETLQRGKPGRPPLPARAAEKREKAAGIREMRDALIAGALAALPRAQPLVDEANVLGWDDNRLLHDTNGSDHHCDAGLYVYRAARHFRFDPTKYRHPPVPGSVEEIEQELRELREHYANPPKERRNRPAWDH